MSETKVMTARDWAERLDMQAHPEGGWFKETYRSAEAIPASGLPERYGASRSISTGIYFLIENGNFSALHRIKSDEMWHFYAGSTLSVQVLHPNGDWETIRLGPNTDALFQTVVPAGCWFGSEVEEEGGYALVGCTVAPGFDFADFELAVADDLAAEYPQHASEIRRLTRN